MDVDKKNAKSSLVCKSDCEFLPHIESEFKKLQKTVEEVQKRSSELAEIESLYDEMRVCFLNGKKNLENIVYIDFDKKNKQYEFRFIKKFVILDTNDNFYMIRLHRDPKAKKWEGNYWDKVDVKVKLTVDDNTYYSDAAPNQFPLLLEAKRKTQYDYEIKVSYKMAENSPIRLSKDTVVTLEYSFKIGADKWGNYIERQVSFDRESIVVYLQNCVDRPLNDNNLIRKVYRYADHYSQTALADYNCVVEDKHYRYEFDVRKKYLPPKEINQVIFRIVWDCDKVFGSGYNLMNDANKESSVGKKRNSN